MRRAPALLSAVFLCITLARVAQFSASYMHAGALGILFAVGLGASVYVSAFWSRTQTTRLASLCGLAFFVCVDALFNFADVWQSADTSTPLIAACAKVYGLFPTVAVALLGWLQSRIASLPPVRKAGTQPAQTLAERAQAWIERMIPEPQPAQPEPEPVADEQEPPEPVRYVCVTCGIGYEKQTSLAAHMRAHAEKKRNGHEKVQA